MAAQVLALVLLATSATPILATVPHPDDVKEIPLDMNFDPLQALKLMGNLSEHDRMLLTSYSFDTSNPPTTPKTWESVFTFYAKPYKDTCFYKASAVKLGYEYTFNMATSGYDGVFYHMQVAGLDSINWGSGTVYVRFPQNALNMPRQPWWPSDGGVVIHAMCINPENGYQSLAMVWMDGCWACAEPTTGYPSKTTQKGTTDVQLTSTMPFYTWCANRREWDKDACATDVYYATCMGEYEPMELQPSSDGRYLCNGRRVRCTDDGGVWSLMGDGIWACRNQLEYRDITYRLGDWIAIQPARINDPSWGPGYNGQVTFSVVKSAVCTKDCGINKYRAASCFWSDFQCTNCDCGKDGFTNNGPCMGTGRNGPVCKDCYTELARERGATISYVGGPYYSDRHLDSYTRFMFTGMTGYYSRYSGTPTYTTTCEAAYGYTRQVKPPHFPLCDPPPAVGALTPYPVHLQDTYKWTCAPGFHSAEDPLPAPVVPLAPIGQQPSLKYGPIAFDGLQAPDRCVAAVVTLPAGTGGGGSSSVEYSYVRVCHYDRITFFAQAPNSRNVAAVKYAGGTPDDGAVLLGVFRSWATAPEWYNNEQGFKYVSARYGDGDKACPSSDGSLVPYAVTLHYTCPAAGSTYSSLVSATRDTSRCEFVVTVAVPEACDPMAMAYIPPIPAPELPLITDDVPETSTTPRTSPAAKYGPASFVNAGDKCYTMSYDRMKVLEWAPADYKANRGTFSRVVNYTICTFSRASILGSGSTLATQLGYFDSWIVLPTANSTSKQYSAQRFRGGSSCGGIGEKNTTYGIAGTKWASVTVSYQCTEPTGEPHIISAVVTADGCRHTVVASVPAVCSDMSAKRRLLGAGDGGGESEDTSSVSAAASNVVPYYRLLAQSASASIDFSPSSTSDVVAPDTDTFAPLPSVMLEDVAVAHHADWASVPPPSSFSSAGYRAAVSEGADVISRDRVLIGTMDARVKPTPTPSVTPTATLTPSGTPTPLTYGIPSQSPSPTKSVSATPSPTPTAQPATPFSGPESLRPWVGRCFSATHRTAWAEGYSYRVCPFGVITRTNMYPEPDWMDLMYQRTPVSPPESLGVFAGWSVTNTSTGAVYESQSYTRGNICRSPNGVPIETFTIERPSGNVVYLKHKISSNVKLVCGVYDSNPQITIAQVGTCNFNITIVASSFCGVNMAVGRENQNRTGVYAAPYVGPTAYNYLGLPPPRSWTPRTYFDLQVKPQVPNDPFAVDSPVATYRVTPFYSVVLYKNITIIQRVEYNIGYWAGWKDETAVNPATGAAEPLYRVGLYKGGTQCASDADQFYTAEVTIVCPVGLPDASDGMIYGIQWTGGCTLSFNLALNAACGTSIFSSMANTTSALPRPVNATTPKEGFSGPSLLRSMASVCYTGTFTPSSDPQLPLVTLPRPARNNSGLEAGGDVLLSKPMAFAVCPFNQVLIYPSNNLTHNYVSAGVYNGWIFKTVRPVSKVYDSQNFTSGVWCPAGGVYFSVQLKMRCLLSTDQGDRLESIVATGPCSLAVTLATPTICGNDLRIGREASTKVVTRQCPMLDNKQGIRWTGDSPIQCFCDHIPGAHRCNTHPVNGNAAPTIGYDGIQAPWVFNGETSATEVGAWGWYYVAPPDVPWPRWGHGGRDGMVVSITPVLSWHGHLYKWHVSSSSLKERGVIYLVTRPSENPWGHALRFRLQLMGYMDDKVPQLPAGHYPMPYDGLTGVPADEDNPPSNPEELEQWYHTRKLSLWKGAAKTIIENNPNAAAFFTFVTYNWNFKFEMRYDGADGRPLATVLGYDPQDGSVPIHEIANPAEYHLRRATISAQFGWLYRKCAAGEYQKGDDCLPCPVDYPDRPSNVRGTYNVYDYAFEYEDSDENPDHLLVDTLVGVCKPKVCKECERVDAATGECHPMDGWCVIRNKCVLSGAPMGLLGNDVCQRCIPAVDDSKWTTTMGAKCSDANSCSFFDTCTGDGFCVGQADDCLRDQHEPSRNCEVCGQDSCDLKQNFTGCVHRDYNGKSCGCQIGNQCVAHGTSYWGNQCLVCDVTRNASGWSISPPKSCDDGIACTHSDMCTDAGVCKGVKYTCPLQDGPIPDFSCIISSMCAGDGTCNTNYKNHTRMCAPSTDPCTPASYCNGTLGYCPLEARRVPTISAGDVSLVLFSSSSASSIATVGNAGASFLLSAFSPSCVGVSNASSFVALPSKIKMKDASQVLPYVDGGIAFPSCFAVRASGFQVGCGWLNFSLGVLPIASAGEGCDEGRAIWTPYGIGTTTPDTLTTQMLMTSTLVSSAGPGSLFRLFLRALNLQGESRTICSSRVYVIATTAPTAGSAVQLDPTDVISSSPRTATQHHGDVLLASWRDFSDNYTSTWAGLFKYRYRVFRTPASAGNASSSVPLPPPSAPMVINASSALLSRVWSQFGAFVDAGLSQSVAIDGTTVSGSLGPIPTGYWYVVEVTGYNRAGLGATIYTQAVLVDRTPAAVLGGAVDGGATGVDTTPLTLSWPGAFADAESGIDRIEVAWGTRRGGTDVLDWTLVPGGQTAASFTFDFSGQWVEGIPYYGSVRAVSGSGATTAAVTAAGQMLDTTPPTGLTLVPPTQAPASRIDLRYSFFELESGMAYISAWARNSSGLRFNPVSTFTGPAYLTSLRLLLNGTFDRQIITFCMNVTNNAGMTSATACTGNILLDAAIPNIKYVRNVKPGATTAPEQIDDPSGIVYHTGPYLSVAFTPCTNEITGIDSHELLVMTTAGNATLRNGSAVAVPSTPSVVAVPWTRLPDPNASSLDALQPSRFVNMSTLLQPVPGQQYWATVRCTTGAGMTNQTTGAPVVVDPSPPVIVTIGLGADPSKAASITATASFNAMTASWDVRDPESGIRSIEWAIGGNDTAHAHAVMPWTTVPNAGYTASWQWVQGSGPALEASTYYRVSVRATSRSGLVTVLRSAPIVVDLTAPVVVDGACVCDGPNTPSFMPLARASAAGNCLDVDYASNITAISASWAGSFTDPETGVIYAWCAGTSAGTCDITANTFIDVGVATSVNVALSQVILPTSRLTHLRGTKVFVSVRATNAAGQSRVLTSDGVMYDDAAPTRGQVQLVDARLPPAPPAITAAIQQKTPLATLLNINDPAWLADAALYANSSFFLSALSDPAALNVNVSLPPPLRVQFGGFATGNIAPLGEYRIAVGSQRGAADIIPFARQNLAPFVVLSLLPASSRPFKIVNGTNETKLPTDDPRYIPNGSKIFLPTNNTNYVADGTTLFVTAQGVTAAGVAVNATPAFTAVYDSSPPEPFQVTIGGGDKKPINGTFYVTDAKKAFICVSKASDPHSGVAASYARVHGCYNGTCGPLVVAAGSGMPTRAVMREALLVPPGSGRGLNPVCSWVTFDPPLPRGQQLTLYVDEVNGAGLVSTATCAGAIVVDSTAPVFPGSNLLVTATWRPETVDYYPSLEISARWLAARDDESSCCKYRIEIGSSPGANNLASFDLTTADIKQSTRAITTTRRGTSIAYLSTDFFLIEYPDDNVVSLPEGQLYVVITATNAAGLASTSSPVSPVLHTVTQATLASPVSIVAGAVDDSAATMYTTTTSSSAAAVAAANGPIILSDSGTLTVLWRFNMPQPKSASDTFPVADVAWVDIDIVVNGAVIASAAAGLQRKYTFTGLPLTGGANVTAVVRVTSAPSTSSTVNTGPDVRMVYNASGIVATSFTTLVNVTVLPSLNATSPRTYLSALSPDLVVSWIGMTAASIAAKGGYAEIAIGTLPNRSDILPFTRAIVVDLPANSTPSVTLSTNKTTIGLNSTNTTASKNSTVTNNSTKASSNSSAATNATAVLPPRTRAYLPQLLLPAGQGGALVLQVYAIVKITTSSGGGDTVTGVSQALTLVKMPPSSSKFQAWNTLIRGNNTAVQTDAVTFNVSWSRPGGVGYSDSECALLTRASSSIVPTGLAGYEVTLFTSPPRTPSSLLNATGPKALSTVTLSPCVTQASLKSPVNVTSGSSVYIQVTAVSVAGLRTSVVAPSVLVDPTIPVGIIIFQDAVIGDPSSFDARWYFLSLRNGRDLTYTISLGTRDSAMGCGGLYLAAPQTFARYTVNATNTSTVNVNGTKTVTVYDDTYCSVSDIAPPRTVGSAMSYRWTDLNVTDGQQIWAKVIGCNALGACAHLVSWTGTTAAFSGAISGAVGLYHYNPFEGGKPAASSSTGANVAADGTVSYATGSQGLGTSRDRPLFAAVWVSPDVALSGNATANSTAIIGNRTSSVGNSSRTLNDTNASTNASSTAATSYDMYVAWEPFVSPYTNVSIDHYTAVLGIGPGSATMGECAYVPGNVTWCVITLYPETAPVHGSTLYATVVGYTQAGVGRAAVSQPLKIDLSSPVLFNVDIPDESLLLGPPFTGIRCNWSGMVDDESGIIAVSVAAGSLPGSADEIPWTAVTDFDTTLNNSDYTFDVRAPKGRDLPGGAYYCGVRATNGAGMTTEAWSGRPAVADFTPPTAGSAVVMDGADPSIDVVWMPPTNMQPMPADSWPDYFNFVLLDVSITWHGFYEPESSIRAYEVGLATADAVALAADMQAPIEPDYRPWVRPPSLVSMTFTEVPVQQGQVLYGVVRAINAVGLRSDRVVSTGQRLDRFAPSISAAALAARDAAVQAGADAALLGLSPAISVMFPSSASSSVQSVSEALLTSTPPILTIGAPYGHPVSQEGATTCRLSGRSHESMAIIDYTVPAYLLRGEDPPVNLASGAAYTGETYADAASYEDDTNSSIVYDLNIAVGLRCDPGFYRADGLGVCLPCSVGTFKPAAGDEASCLQCPARTAGHLMADLALITDITQQTRYVTHDAGGATACGCVDDTQVEFPAANNTDASGARCLCAAGYLPSPEYVRDQVLGAYRGTPSQPPTSTTGEPLTMCVKLTGTAYKWQAGDDAMLADTCPVGTKPSTDHSTCICGLDQQAFDNTTQSCSCKAGTFWQASAPGAGADDGNTTTSGGKCVRCPAGTFKPTVGDDQGLCVACPWASKPTAASNACEADHTYVPGTVFLPASPASSPAAAPSVARRLLNNSAILSSASLGSVACPPGTTLNAQYGSYVRSGVLFRPVYSLAYTQGLAQAAAYTQSGGITNSSSSYLNYDNSSQGNSSVAGYNATTYNSSSSLPDGYPSVGTNYTNTSGYNYGSGNATLANYTICIEPPNLVLSSTGSTVRSLNGQAMVSGTRVTIMNSGINISAILHGSPSYVRHGDEAYPSDYAPSLIKDVEQGKVDAFEVEAASCFIPVAAWSAACTACPSGTFQPFNLPFASYSDADALSGACGSCPVPAASPSAFTASTDRSIYIDWSTLFSDDGGSGISRFTVAVGTVPGGSQVVPFLVFAANQTRAAFHDVDVSPGTPMYVTVVAHDVSGNSAVFEDTRPVVWDATPPVAGAAKDADLDAWWLSIVDARIAAFNASVGTNGSAALLAAAVSDPTDAGVLVTQAQALMQSTDVLASDLIATGAAGSDGDSGSLAFLIMGNSSNSSVGGGSYTASQMRVLSAVTSYLEYRLDTQPTLTVQRGMSRGMLTAVSAGSGTVLAYASNFAPTVASKFDAPLKAASTAAMQQQFGSGHSRFLQFGNDNTTALPPAPVSVDASAAYYTPVANASLTAFTLPVDPRGTVRFACPNGDTSGSTCAVATGFCRAWRGRTGDTGVAQYAIAAMSSGHGCAITAAGYARCWGRNWAGQAPAAPVVGISTDGVSVSPFRHITVNDEGCSCGLTDTGSIDCWGNTSNTGCPNLLGSSTLRFRHVTLPPTGAFAIAVTSGANRSAVCYGDARGPGCVSMPEGSLPGPVIMAVAQRNYTCVLVQTSPVRSNSSARGPVVCNSQLWSSPYTFVGPYASITSTPYELCGIRSSNASSSGAECWQVPNLSPTTIMQGELSQPLSMAARYSGGAPSILLDVSVAARKTFPAALVATSGARSSQRIVYSVSEDGAIGSFDAGVATGGPCANGDPQGLCASRSAASALLPPYAHVAGSYGIRAGSSIVYAGVQPLGTLTCVVTCGLSLACFGADDALVAALPSSDLRLPCALRTPVDISDTNATTSATMPPAKCIPLTLSQQVAASASPSPSPIATISTSNSTLNGTVNGTLNGTSAVADDSNTTTFNITTAVTTASVISNGRTGRPAGVCDLNGLWADGSIVMTQSQSGTMANAFLTGEPGSSLEAAGVFAWPGDLANVTKAQVVFIPTAAGDYNYAAADGITYDGYWGGKLAFYVPASIYYNDSDPSQGTYAGWSMLVNGSLSADCSSISWSDGSTWNATSRCGARFLRISVGSVASAASLYAAPSPYTSLPWLQQGAGVNSSVTGLSFLLNTSSAAPFRGMSAIPSELLALSEVRLLDQFGNSLVGASNVITASSAACDCASMVPSSCAALAFDGSNATSFTSASAWGNSTCKVNKTAPADPYAGAWLQVDLGYNAPIDAISITRRFNATNVLMDALWGWQMAGVTIKGYGASSAVALTAGSPTDVAAITPVFTLTIRRNPWEFTSSRTTWSWGGMAKGCGYDPVPSPSPSASVTPSVTPSISKTPSATPTVSSSNTSTPSASPSVSASPSQSASASVTPVWPSHSVTPTPSPSITPSPAPIPLVYSPANASTLFSTEEQLLAAADAAAGLGTTSSSDRAVLAAQWRRNASFTTLDAVPDLEWSYNTSKLALAWEPFEDTGSGIASIGFCFGTAPYACDVRDWELRSTTGPTDAQARLTVDSVVVVLDTPIPSGTMVYGTVAAVNNLGLSTLITTNGITLDDRPPAIDRVLDTGKYFLHPDYLPTSGTVIYRPPIDIDCDVAGNGVGASWRDVAAAVGVGYYEWAVGLAANGTEILPWTHVGTAVAVYNESISVPAGAVYYVSVRATGITGAIAYRSSDGVRLLRPDEAGERMLCVQAQPLA